jgi:hypothetical protein
MMVCSFAIALFGVGVLFFTPCVIDAASLQLAWNANGEEDLRGYRLYYGTSPRSYGSSIDVGDCTSYELAHLDQGVTYYIAVSALDTSDNESEKSNETSGVARGPEMCTDGIDNDGNGYTDCEDPACSNQACNDNSVCTTNDQCENFLCQGTPLQCDDGNICTDDSCDPLSGCMYGYNTAPCDDALFCNGYDTCNAGSCFIHAGDPCQERHCNEEENVCEDLGIISDTEDFFTTSTGKWNVSVGLDFLGGSALVSQKKATYTWTADLFQTGYYEIYMWWSSLPGSCSNCPVTVSCDEVLVETVSVDQMYNGGQWNLLGTFDFEAGSTCSVTIRSEGSGCETCADAVKLVYSGEFVPEAHIDFIYPNPARIDDEVCFEGHGIPGEERSIENYSWVSDRDGELSNDSAFCVSSLSEGTHQVSLRVENDTAVWSVPVSEALYIGEVAITCDNGESCTSKTGKWKVVETSHAYRGTSLTASKNATYTWTPDLLHAGYYEIYMWWDASLVNCDSCPVTLTCNGELRDTFSINQRQDGEQWNLLGTYELATGNGCSVTIRSEGGFASRTAADAVRFVFTDNLPDSQTLFFH